MIYYRYLFKNREGLSPNEGLVYSALLSHSLMTSEHFNLNGRFDIEAAKAFVRMHLGEDGFECIDYIPLSTRKLMKQLDMAENTVRKTKNLLMEKGLFDDSSIFCPLELLEMGYIDIPSNTKLKGRQLTFYGLLLDRSSRYGGVTDTWAYKLAELAGVTEGNVYALLNLLHKKGFLERRKDGKLLIK